jgi:hypothetical protein
MKISVCTDGISVLNMRKKKEENPRRVILITKIYEQPKVVKSGKSGPLLVDANTSISKVETELSEKTLKVNWLGVTSSFNRPIPEIRILHIGPPTSHNTAVISVEVNTKFLVGSLSEIKEADTVDRSSLSAQTSTIKVIVPFSVGPSGAKKTSTGALPEGFERTPHEQLSPIISPP